MTLTCQAPLVAATVAFSKHAAFSFVFPLLLFFCFPTSSFLLFSFFFSDKCGSLHLLPGAQSGVFQLCLAFIRLVLN